MTDEFAGGYSDRLSTLGNVYVTTRAARDYLSDTPGLDGLEAARRELTELLLDAHMVSGATPGEHSAPVRLRRASDGLDLSARVVLVGRLIVVLTCRARREGRRCAS